MDEAITSAERLLDLVIALSQARGRMTKAEIRSRVAGYDRCAGDAAFDRMFERDKELLRELGVPILTHTDLTHGDDVGYTIDAAAYALPEVEFTPAEMGVLAVAREVWRDSALRTSADRGLTKIRGLGLPTEKSVGSGLALAVRPAGPTLEPLLRAIGQHRCVSFDYLAASTGRLTRRRLEPWRLWAKGRGWYVTGRDVDRDDKRTFRLSRIVSAVRLGPPEAFTPPDPLPVDDGEAAARPERTARLALAPERALLLRRRARPVGQAGPEGRDLVEVRFADTEELAAELAGLGEAAVVLEPGDLRRAVVRRLRAVVAGEADLGGHAADAPAGGPAADAPSEGQEVSDA